MLRLAFALVMMAGAALADAIPAGFNDDGIDWHDLETGLAKAVTEDKPVFAVVHATWCPRCREYRELFFDEFVEDAADQLVFVLIDADQEPEFAKTLAPDGEYVPRSFVLVDGKPDLAIRGGMDDFKYYLHPTDPGELHGALEQALAHK